MNKIIPVLCLIFAIAACGDDNPADSGQPVVNQTFNLPSGTSEDFGFTVDTDIQQNVILQGEFSVENGSVQMAVVTESQYQIWRAGSTPTVIYSTDIVSEDTFSFSIDDSDTYYIVFLNNGPDTVTVNAEIFLLSTAEQEI
ncbi:MAG: hypothetical protein F4Y39_09565 [Gemmatimonadetes bacterium]|nr:hypothetical protein [Gemmatimonadota bacterium]MYK50242.1 hypothetical protein [Gemmatimonadota bacterium]